MAASNSLKKYTCFEWIVSFDGGESPMFLLQNHKCRLDLEFGPKKTTDHVLTIKSESKIALSFAVKVQVVYGKSITTDPTKTVQGIAPYEVWRRDFGEFATMKYDFLIFRVMFAESSNIELIEDANVKTVETQTSSLKKVTCLEWITNGDPQNMESPRFLIGNLKFYFNFDERRGCSAFSRLTLALDSDTKERLRFDAEFQVGWGFGEVTRGRKSFKGKPPYLLWRSDFLDDLRKVLYFRVFFYNGLKIKLIGDGDAKTGKNLKNNLIWSSDLGKMLGSNASDSKSDATVQCGGTTISAHQNILATRSDVPKAELKRKEAESDPIVLQIESIQPSVCGNMSLSDASELKLDGIVQCGDTTISANQNILATGSDVLEAMLQTNEAESGPRVLQIEGMQPSACEKMSGSNASDSKSDETVECGDTTISAHQNILTTGSDVQKAELQRKEAESDPIVLHIEGIQPSACEKMLGSNASNSESDETVECGDTTISADQNSLATGSDVPKVELQTNEAESDQIVPQIEGIQPSVCGNMLGSNASDSKSDVTVQCGDKTFSAHQNILATGSDVLKAMLQTNEAESGPRVLQIEGMQPSACWIFLEYLYTSTLPNLSVELATALYEAAVKYGVVSLKKQCSDFLRENYPDDKNSELSEISVECSIDYSDTGNMSLSDASESKCRDTTISAHQARASFCEETFQTKTSSEDKTFRNSS